MFAIGGFRQGFVTATLSFFGFFGGAVIGAQLADPVAGRLAQDSSWRIAVAVAVVLAFALLGQVSRSRSAASCGQRLTWRPAQTVDSVLGAVVSAIAVLLVFWMVATPLAAAPFPRVASAVRDSQVIRGVDDVVPRQVRSLYSSLRDAVRSYDFPGGVRAAGADPGTDGAGAGPGAVAAARRSPPYGRRSSRSPAWPRPAPAGSRGPASCTHRTGSSPTRTSSPASTARPSRSTAQRAAGDRGALRPGAGRRGAVRARPRAAAAVVRAPAGRHERRRDRARLPGGRAVLRRGRPDPGPDGDPRSGHLQRPHGDPGGLLDLRRRALRQLGRPADRAGRQSCSG